MRKTTIVVFFALVLFSLAFVWLLAFSGCVFDTPVFGTLCGNTDDLTQVAQSKLQETFQNTQNNFAIWPDRYDLRRAYEIKLSAGIRNDAEGEQNHSFVINIIPATASGSVCPSSDISSCTAPNGASLKKFMQGWASWDSQPGVISIGGVGFRTISIRASSDAVPGIYTFNIIACMDVSSYSECNLSTTNWGTPQQLAITVK